MGANRPPHKRHACVPESTESLLSELRQSDLVAACIGEVSQGSGIDVVSEWPTALVIQLVIQPAIG